MGLAEAVKTGFSKSFRFSGRASRSEFWWFALVWLLPFLTILILVTQLMIGLFEKSYESRPYTIGFVILIPWLTATLPLIAAIARRGHDTGVAQHFMILPFLLLYPSLILQLGLMMPDGGSLPDYQLWAGLANLAWLVFSIAFLLLILIRASDPAPNRYGPPTSEVTQ